MYFTYVCMRGIDPKIADYWTTGDHWGVLCNKWMVNSLYFTVKSILQYCVCHKIPWRPCRLQNRVLEWTIQLLSLPRRLNCSNATGYGKFYKQHSFQCVATLFNIACLLLAQCWLWTMAPRLLEQNRSTFPSGTFPIRCSLCMYQMFLLYQTRFDLQEGKIDIRAAKWELEKAESAISGLFLVFIETLLIFFLPTGFVGLEEWLACRTILVVPLYTLKRVHMLFGAVG